MQIEPMRRLPFESETDHPTKGAYGEVNKVTISAYCFKTRKGGIASEVKPGTSRTLHLTNNSSQETLLASASHLSTTRSKKRRH